MFDEAGFVPVVDFISRVAVVGAVLSLRDEAGEGWFEVIP
jgi:hypothetical protein